MTRLERCLGKVSKLLNKDESALLRKEAASYEKDGMNPIDAAKTATSDAMEDTVEFYDAMLAATRDSAPDAVPALEVYWENGTLEIGELPKNLHLLAEAFASANITQEKEIGEKLGKGSASWAKPLAAWIKDKFAPVEKPAPKVEAPPKQKRAPRTIDTTARASAFRVINSGDYPAIYALSDVNIKRPAKQIPLILARKKNGAKLTNREIATLESNQQYSDMLLKGEVAAMGPNGKAAAEILSIIMSDSKGDSPSDAAGYLGQGTSTNEMWQQLRSELKAVALGLSMDHDPRNDNREWTDAEIAAEEAKAATPKQTAEFGEANDFDFGRDEVSTAEMKEGDTVTIDGEEMVVEAVEEDGSVVLRDGARFGRQTLESGETVWVETAEAPLQSDEDLEPVATWLVDEAVDQGYGSADEFAATDREEFDRLAQERIEAAQRDVAEEDSGEVPEDRGPAQGSEVGGWQTRNSRLGEEYKEAADQLAAAEKPWKDALAEAENTLPPGFKTIPYEDGMVALQDADGNNIRYPLTQSEAVTEAWSQTDRDDRYSKAEALEKSPELVAARQKLKDAGEAWNANGDHPQADQIKQEMADRSAAEQRQREAVAKGKRTRAAKKEEKKAGQTAKLNAPEGIANTPEARKRKADISRQLVNIQAKIHPYIQHSNPLVAKERELLDELSDMWQVGDITDGQQDLIDFSPAREAKKPAHTSKMDIRNADSKELFADDGGFKLGQDSTVDGDKVVAARKAKDDAKAAMDAAQGDIFSQQDATPEKEAEAPAAPAEAKPDAKSKKPKEPSAIALLENYFTPGKIVKSYGGEDRVISFDRGEGEQWSVTVQAVDDSDGRGPRSHSTMPSNRDLIRAWQTKNEEQAAKEAAPEQAADVSTAEIKSAPVEERNLNARHTVNLSDVLTPAGAIKASVLRKDSDSSVWHYQGNFQQLAFNVNVTINGESDASDYHRKALAEVKAAQADGWRGTVYKAASFGSMRIFVKGDKVLTNAGAEALVSGKFATPEIDNEREGWQGMASQQAEFSSKLANWLATLPDSTLDSASAFGAKVSTTKIGEWLQIERSGSGVKLWLVNPQDKRRAVAISGETLQDALKTVISYAANTRDGVTTDNAFGFHSFTNFPGVQEAATVGDALRAAGFKKQEEASSDAAPITNLSTLFNFFDQLREGKVTADEVKAAWGTYKGVENELRKEVVKMTMKELERFQGMRKPDNKAEAVKMAMEFFEGRFNPGNMLSYGGVMGRGDMNKARRDAMDKAASQWTDEVIQSQAQERKDAKAARDKALENPETLDEWKQFVRRKGLTGLSPEEIKAFNAERSPYALEPKIMARGEGRLTPEQLSAYDEVRGIDRKSAVQAKKEQESTVRGVNADTDSEIIETKHTKTGADLFVVKLADRVEKDVYTSLNAAAKKMGGYYSSYRVGGAVPGFQFKDRATAEQFQAITKGETVDRAEAVQERQAESKNAAAERLTAMADKMEEAAEASLNADRKTNTAKRAREAGTAETSARTLKALATTMRNLASAIESGNATHLDGVRTKTHVDTLEALARRAKSEAERTEDLSYGERQKREGEPTTPEQIDKTKYPFPFLNETAWQWLIDNGNNTPGAKRLTARLEKVFAAKPSAKENGSYLTGADMIEVVKELLGKIKKRDYTRTNIEDVFKPYDRVQAMGLKDLPSLRAALREFLQYRGTKAKADPIKAMERELIGMKIPGFFPTPPAVIERMIESAGDLEGKRVLEPSAGKGDLADAARSAGGQVDTAEVSSRLRDILFEKKHNVVANDFMSLFGNLPTTTPVYDVVLMNPPFEDGQDGEHVQRAFQFLKPGGKLVAITGEGIFFRSDKKSQAFRDWLESVDGTSEKLPEGSFKSAFRPTGVATRIVVITKPADALRAGPLPRSAPISRPQGTIIQDITSDFSKTPAAFTFKPSNENDPIAQRIAKEQGIQIVSSEDLRDPQRRFEERTGARPVFFTGGNPETKGFIEASAPSLIFVSVGEANDESLAWTLIHELIHVAQRDRNINAKAAYEEIIDKHIDDKTFFALQKVLLDAGYHPQEIGDEVQAYVFTDVISGKSELGLNQLPQYAEMRDAIFAYVNGLSGLKPRVIKPTLFSKSMSAGPLPKAQNSDKEYLAAVEAGDMETAQRMVDAAAKAAGYSVKAFHGTDSKPFNVFKETGGTVTVLFSSYDVKRRGHFFAEDVELAKSFGKRTIPVFLKTGVVADMSTSDRTVEDRLVAEKEWNEKLLLQAETWELFDEENGDQFVEDLKGLGYDSALIQEPSVEGERGFGETRVVFSSDQIKSADPVTRDDQGNVIQLSQRFNPASDSILYAGPAPKPAPEPSPVFRYKVPIKQDWIDEAEAHMGVFGAGSMGTDPKFANFGGKNQSVRNQVDIVRAYDMANHETRKDRDTFARAKELLAKDPDGVYKMAMDGAYTEGAHLRIDDHQQLAIQMLVQRLGGQANGNKTKIKALQSLIWANILNRKEAARTLRAGIDRFMTPAERADQQVADLIFRLHPKIEKRAKTMTYAERKAFFEQAGDARIKEVEAALKKAHGLRLDQVLRQRNDAKSKATKLEREILKLKKVLDQNVIQMIKKGATLKDIERVYHVPPEAALAMLKAHKEAIAARLRQMFQSGMTVAQIKEAEKDNLRAGPIKSDKNEMTPDQIEAEIARMIGDDYKLPEESALKNRKALPKAPKAKPKAEMTEAEIEAAETSAMEKVAKRWIDKFSNSTTYTKLMNRNGKPLPVLSELIKKHLKSPIADFIQQVEKLGVTSEQAKVLEAEAARERDVLEHVKAIKKGRKATSLTTNWSKPAFYDGLNGYEFDTKDRAGIMDRVEKIRMIVGAVGQINLLTGPKQEQAKAALAEIDSILSKYGTNAEGILNANKGIESYGFDPTDMVQMAAIARTINQIDADWIDKTMEFLYANMLWGPQTAIVNATAAAHAVYQMTVGRGMEMAINHFVNDPMAAQFGEVKYIIRALKPGLRRAMSNFHSSWLSQHPMVERDMLGSDVDWEAHAGGFRNQMKGGVIGGKFGDLHRTPLRILSATDDFNKTLFGMAEAAAFAYRLGVKKSKTKSDALFGKGPGTPDFEKFMRIEMNTPGSFSMKMGVDKASRMIFAQALPGQKNHYTGEKEQSDDIGGVIGVGAAKLNEFVSGGEHDSIAAKALLAMMRISFFPFQRTPFNIVRTGMRYAPNPISMTDILWGVASNSRQINASTGKMEFKWNAQGRNPELIERVSMQLQGAVVMAALMAMAVGEGDDDDQDKWLVMTGTAPWSPAKRAEKEARERSGVGAYRVSWRRGDGSERAGFSYARIEPLATAGSTIIDTLRTIKRIIRNGGDASDIAANTLGGLVAQTKDKTFLRGFSDLTDLMTNAVAADDVKEPNQRKLNQFIVGKMAMAIPNFVKQPLREADNTFRERSDSFSQELMYQVFPYGQKAAKVDPYGDKLEKQKLTGSEAADSAIRAVDFIDAGIDKVNPVDRMLLRWRDSGKWKQAPDEADRKPWFPSPIISATFKNKVTGQTVKMDVEQLSEFREKAGKAAAAKIKSLNLNYKNPSPRDILLVKKAVEDARSSMKTALSHKFSRTEKQK